MKRIGVGFYGCDIVEDGTLWFYRIDNSAKFKNYRVYFLYNIVKNLKNIGVFLSENKKTDNIKILDLRFMPDFFYDVLKNFCDCERLIILEYHDADVLNENPGFRKFLNDQEIIVNVIKWVCSADYLEHNKDFLEGMRHFNYLLDFKNDLPNKMRIPSSYVSGMGSFSKFIRTPHQISPKVAKNIIPLLPFSHMPEPKKFLEITDSQQVKKILI